MSEGRVPPREDVEAKILVASRRRCAYCFGLEDDLGVKIGQIAHIDRIPSRSNFDDLAFLCTEHHALYDSRSSQAKGYTPKELRTHRDALYAYFAGDATLASRVERVPVLKPIEALYLLLLIDQFPIGLWGVSLSAKEDFYGHAGDPGSITISTYASLGITLLTGARHHASIRDFREYLIRRRSDRGAFGMKRPQGTKYPEAPILEHARHTATALRFFLEYDGPRHPYVVAARDYLLDPEARTPSGVWVDHGEQSDSRADPVTAAMIVGNLECLLQLDRDSGGDSETGRHEELEAAIRNGLEYIFTCSLRTDPDGYWIFRYSNDEEYQMVLRNQYQYTTDVLVHIAGPCKRLGLFSKEVSRIIEALLRIRKFHEGGVPVAPSSNLADLDTTASLVNAMSVMGRSQEETAEIFQDLLSLLSKPDVVQHSSANGWSSVLLLSSAPCAGEIIPAPERVAYLDELAFNLKQMDPENPEIPSNLPVSAEFARWILQRRQQEQPR